MQGVLEKKINPPLSSCLWTDKMILSMLDEVKICMELEGALASVWGSFPHYTGQSEPV